MSRLREFAAAGLQILNAKPAFVAQYGQVPCLLMAGPFVLLATLVSLVGPASLPLPPRKPDMAALILESDTYQQAAYHSGDGLDAGPYRSRLGGEQMDLYRDIFRLQGAGALKEADALIPALQDKALMGHILAQRYLHASYKAGFDELKSWLAAYGDHPEAGRIARLANARMPAGHGEMPKASYIAYSIEEMEEHAMASKSYAPGLSRSPDQNVKANTLIRTIRGQIQRYEPSAALRTFNESPVSIYLDDVEKDRIRAMIASGYLYAGKTAEALTLSGAALRGSHGRAPLAGWVNGLSQWRVKNYDAAARSFEVAAESPYASGWMVSAASYWAARSHGKQGNQRRMTHWLDKAAAYPRTFYGLLAAQSLGNAINVNWQAPRLTGDQEREILATKAGQRAEKLLAAGEVTLAEAEIRSLYVRGDAGRKKALLAYAYDRKLPSLSMRLAHAVGRKDQLDSALYPAMPWTPNKGYRIDRALLHAIVRQESRFNAAAENQSSGATGLMQLMPRTASHVAKTDLYREGEGRNLLKMPQVSLDLGQDYVEELLNNAMVGQDLLSLAIAYNAGPGKLAKWKAERPDIDDPLLFIETIPYAETRNYVERVMANYWIYRMRFDQPNDSMQALAEGRWARYAAYDKGALRFAAAE